MNGNAQHIHTESSKNNTEYENAFLILSLLQCHCRYIDSILISRRHQRQKIHPSCCYSFNLLPLETNRKRHFRCYYLEGNCRVFVTFDFTLVDTNRYKKRFLLFGSWAFFVGSLRLRTEIKSYVLIVGAPNLHILL